MSSTKTIPASSTTTSQRRSPTPPALRVGRIGDPLLIGILGAVIGVTFAWVPSLWYDEAATVVSAERSWAALGEMLTTVDGVHATYYSGMHLRFNLVGYTPFSLRFPSAIATGAAAALTVVLGRMLGGRRVGVLAGAAFCVLPRMTWMGLEGRSFALGTVFAVGSTILFVAAWRRTVDTPRGSAWWWVAYVFVAILGSAVFLYLVLIVVGHGVSVALVMIRDRKKDTPSASRWRSSARWGFAALLIVVSVIPLALLASRQSGQIHWIKKPSWHTFEEVFTTQFFYENLPFAVLAWSIVGIGLLAASRPGNRGQRDVLLIAVPWMVVPTVGLIAVSMVHTPLYSPRYVSFATPAAALAVGVGLAAVPWRPVTALCVAALVALSVPTIIAQRQVTAKDSSAWNQVAALVARERAQEPTGVTDDVIYGPVNRHPLTTSRIISDTYPAAFTGLRDIALKQPGAQTNHTWATNYPLADVVRQTSSARDVWLVTGTTDSITSTVTKELKAYGFHSEHAWSFTGTDVVCYER